MVAAREIEGLPVVAAKGEVGRGRGAVDDAAELFAIAIHDPDSARAAAINTAFDIHLHAVRNTRLVAAQIGKNRSVALASVPLGSSSNARIWPRRESLI